MVNFGCKFWLPFLNSGWHAGQNPMQAANATAQGFQCKPWAVNAKFRLTKQIYVYQVYNFSSIILLLLATLD